MAHLHPRKALKVGNYFLMENGVIGRGSSGEVRAGEHCETCEPVAIKVLEKAWIHRNRMGAAVTREVGLMAGLRHPNVVKLVEVMNSKTHVYVVLERVEGKELYDEIVSKERLTEEAAGNYFTQLVRGLSYLHAMGVSHRDIKPENLLVSMDGSLKIIDFGLSASLGPVGDAAVAAAAGGSSCGGSGGSSGVSGGENSSSGSDSGEFSSPGSDLSGRKGDPEAARSHRRLRTVCGTPFYTAPEVFRGGGGRGGTGYDGRAADVWSAGVVLFTMLAGRLPFEGTDVHDTLRIIDSCRPKYPASFSPDARALVDGMLARDAAKRLTLAEVAAHPWFRRHDRPDSLAKQDQVRPPSPVPPPTARPSPPASEADWDGSPWATAGDAEAAAAAAGRTPWASPAGTAVAGRENAVPAKPAAASAGDRGSGKGVTATAAAMLAAAAADIRNASLNRKVIRPQSWAPPVVTA
ncbi:unnamed protein product [Phaeothamnion confervicola]